MCVVEVRVVTVVDEDLVIVVIDARTLVLGVWDARAVLAPLRLLGVGLGPAHSLSLIALAVGAPLRQSLAAQLAEGLHTRVARRAPGERLLHVGKARVEVAVNTERHLPLRQAEPVAGPADDLVVVEVLHQLRRVGEEVLEEVHDIEGDALRLDEGSHQSVPIISDSLSLASGFTL